MLGSIFVDLVGVELDSVERDVLQHPQVAGIVLFARNFLDSSQLADLIRCIREANPYLIVAVDQEGGRVQRFKEGFTRIPPMGSLGAAYRRKLRVTETLASNLGWVMASELRSHGVNLSFAPVLDLDIDKSDVIGDRSFDDDPKATCLLASAFISGMNAAGMPATGKHFPGHGAIKADTHIEIAQDFRSFDEIESRDLVPFTKLANQLGAIMPAHVIFPEVDPQPVGYSPFWIGQVLRERLGFQGCVVSDDLGMSAAAVAGSMSDRAFAAIDAGCDTVLICNNFEQAVQTLERFETKNHCASEKWLKFAKSSAIKQAWKKDELKKSPRWVSTQKMLEDLF